MATEATVHPPLDFDPELAARLFQKLSEHLALCTECLRSAHEADIPLKRHHVDPMMVGIEAFMVWSPLARIMATVHPKREGMD